MVAKKAKTEEKPPIGGAWGSKPAETQAEGRTLAEAQAEQEQGFTTDTASGQPAGGIKQPQTREEAIQFIAEQDGPDGAEETARRLWPQFWPPIVDEQGKDASEAAKVKARGKTKAEKAADAQAAQAAAAKQGQGDSNVNLTNMSSDLVKGIEQIERIAEEIGALKDDQKEYFDSLKAKGYSLPVIRKVLARRQMDPDKREAMDSMLELYEDALRGA